MIVIDNDYIPRCCGDCYVGFTKQIGCEKHIGFENYAIERHPDCPIKCNIEDIKAEIENDIRDVEVNTTEFGNASVRFFNKGIRTALKIIDKHTKGGTNADNN